MLARQLLHAAQDVRASPSQPAVQPRLTPRQQEVANLVACGLCDCEIAAKLGISENTVGDHLKVIFRQHGVHTRTALVVALVADQRVHISTSDRQHC